MNSDGRPSTLLRFDNATSSVAGRRFPGFPSSTAARVMPLPPRQCLRQDLRPGDLLSLTGTGPQRLQLLAFDPRGQASLQALGLAAGQAVDTSGFDSGALLGWLAACGGDLRQARSAAVPVSTTPLVLKTHSAITVWIAHPLDATSLVNGTLAGEVQVSYQPCSRATPLLPPALGALREEFTVSRASALAYTLRRGEVVQIIDVEGQQCSDFTAFRAGELERGQEWMIDGTATRSMVRRAFPGPGLLDKFYDAHMRPMLQVLQDTCGRHDTFGLACTARGYEERGFPGHINCSDNMSAALAPYGVATRPAWPAINFFWNTWVDPHTHHILTEESHSRAGDYVAMRAIEDLVCVSTACPDDIDPINGWNPTDIHVRIYHPETPVRRAVAYRRKEDAPMSISRPSVFQPRLAPLTEHFAPARDLWSPTHFAATGAVGEYWACRESATLQDMSGLRKFDVVGPDAETLLQRVTTRNVAKLAVWRGSYTLICDQSGQVIDDGTLFRLAPDLFRWCCGSEESGRVLADTARDLNLQVRVNALGNSLPNLALQGPKSRDILHEVVFTQPHVPALAQLKWFGVTVARLHDREGAPFMLSRSGYTGELGYEIFCAESDALALWDALMAAGQPHGLVPMGTEALETIRIEAGLAAAQAEFAPGIDAYEAGLGFAVDLAKPAFSGQAALERNHRDPRRLLKGLKLESNDTPAHGAPVFAGERQVGEVTSATRSPSLGHAIAMARLAVEHADDGTRLEVGQLDGHMKRLPASVCPCPFVDPQRRRARA